MKLTFWGAAKTVTGSMHHLETGGKRYLLDCGLYQGRRQDAFERNSHFPFPADSIESVILSHAHMDHSGNLPTLVKNGFSGPIYTTPATIDLCLAMLADSAFIQQKDAEFVNRRRQYRKAKPEDRPAEPLYGTQDAERTYPLFHAIPLGERKEINPGIAYTTYDAGHMLGSTSMVVEADGRRLAFSGDVGRPGLPILRDPQRLHEPVDYLIMESTYGNRLHKQLGHAAETLEDVVNRTAARGGKIIVPAFAVGRTQQLVLLLHQLIDEKRIPTIPMFVDSPLAINATEVFRKHPECFDEEARAYLTNGNDPFGFYRLQYVHTAEESKKLNGLRTPAVIIAASGMCEAGRILHHLRNNIEDPRNTVLITGFQAEHTLGRKILEKQPTVPVFGEPMSLRAEVCSLEELSGHADQKELIEWMRPIAKGLKKVFLVHGEPEAGAVLGDLIRKEYGIEVAQPSRGESFELG